MDSNVQKRRENKKSLRVKVISLGNAEVGKSCIIKRYCEKRFVPKYLATIGIDYGVTKVQVRDREIKVNIFDMAGHPFFYEVRNEFYKDSQGVVLVYDVGLRESFDALDSWLAEMKQEMGSMVNMESIVFVVCANKVDLTKRRVVDEGVGRLWAESRGFHYFETSAQSGEGISEVFQVCIHTQFTISNSFGSSALNNQYTSSFLDKHGQVNKFITRDSNHFCELHCMVNHSILKSNRVLYIDWLCHSSFVKDKYRHMTSSNTSSAKMISELVGDFTTKVGGTKTGYIAS
uniref:DnaJ (Hsp40) homolog, subfamily C, member 27 n=1 Tax=Hucho hucho TaxID=62062 RepID=A0A4W5MHN4_9TELE